MPRRSTKEEATAYMAQFFADARQRLTEQMVKTMQPKRRNEMFNTIQAIDKVEAEFYNWANGVNDNAA